jgi:hypothetical protein
MLEASVELLVGQRLLVRSPVDEGFCVDDLVTLIRAHDESGIAVEHVIPINGALEVFRNAAHRHLLQSVSILPV